MKSETITAKQPVRSFTRAEADADSGVLVVGKVRPQKSISAACALCKTKPWKKRRNLAGGAIPFISTELPPHGASDVMVWCPQRGHELWHDFASEDNSVILEYLDDEEHNRQHINDMCCVRPVRVTFLKNANGGPKTRYKFVGVYRLDEDETLARKKCVWRRSDIQFNLNNYIKI